MGDTDKKADEIVEETLKEIYDDINTSDNSETSGVPTQEEPETTEELEKALESVPQETEDAEEESEESSEEDSKEDSEEEDADEEDFEEGVEILGEDDLDDAEDSEEEEEEFLDEDDSDEEEEEETEAQKEYRKHKRRKKAAIIIGSIFGVLLLIYLGLAFYFSSHFMFFTTINGTDFTMKNVAQVETQMEQQVADYELTLEESDNDAEEIKGSDISLTYVKGTELTELVKAQDNFLWPKTLWDHPEIEAAVGVDYNENQLAGLIENLACMQEENQTESVDAHPEFQNTEFVVVPEIIGTQINTEVFNKAVADAISGFQPTLNLSEANCYVLPTYFSDSTEVIEAKDTMNSYLGAKITYDFNPSTEVVDSSVIATWVKVNAKMKVTFDKKAVKEYIASLAEKYNTRGKNRKFTTATGKVVTVEGGDYGWKIDEDAEYKALTKNIEKAETVSREPKYSSKAASHGDIDVGDTYAEVDLSNQKAYFIKNGKVVLESDVVTGNPNRGNATPQGTYSLTYKTRNAVLRGRKQPDGTYEYESPVSFWMPFNGGIGFHDATWQSAFGGSRYRSHGSHGCVNMPYSKAEQMYGLISDGTPVVCHY